MIWVRQSSGLHLFETDKLYGSRRAQKSLAMIHRMSYRLTFTHAEIPEPEKCTMSQLVEAWHKADKGRFPADLRDWLERAVRLWQDRKHQERLRVEIYHIWEENGGMVFAFLFDRDHGRLNTAIMMREAILRILVSADTCLISVFSVEVFYCWPCLVFCAICPLHCSEGL